MSKRIFYAETDSEDYIYLTDAGDLSVEEDGSSSRTFPLTRKQAIDLASALLQYGTQK